MKHWWEIYHGVSMSKDLWALATIIEWTHLSLVLSYTPNPNPNVQLCNHGMQHKRKGKGSMYYLFPYPLHFTSSLFSFSRMSYFPYLLFSKLSKPSFIRLFTLLMISIKPFFLENWVLKFWTHLSNPSWSL